MQSFDTLIAKAREGTDAYLDQALAEGRIDQSLYGIAKKNTAPNLKKWLSNDYIAELSPGLRPGIAKTIEAEDWVSIVNAFRQEVRFGTGGIRGMMAFDRESIVQLFEEGLTAPILRGPNTINDVVLRKTSAGVAKFGKEQPEPFQRIVIGYDSRVRGHDLAAAVAQVFLAFDYTVYFFDDPCPYPEVTFAIPFQEIQADVGILISASHNDYRYNGYKLSCANGSQFDPEQRDVMYKQYIAPAVFEDIKVCPFADAPKDRLFFLGGAEPVEGYDYCGREDKLVNVHDRHRDHVKSFLMDASITEKQSDLDDPLKIAFCAFHGAGRIAVPRLLNDIGFPEIKVIHENGLNDLNGLFPSFCSDPGKEQQPDPGDKRAAKVAVESFEKEYPGEFEDIDILIGTDPDADRCGIVVKVPEGQEDVYGGSYYLLPADDAWTLLLWYRLNCEAGDDGKVANAERKFATLSMTTSDAITKLALKYDLGVVKTWVGFAALAGSTGMIWRGEVDPLLKLNDGRDGEDYKLLCHPMVCECLNMDAKRDFNIGAMEQSNGFSLLGGPPKDFRSLGEDGHVRDKDGTFAAVLMTELAAWAKERGTNLIELLDQNVYLDPDIGLFANFYEPDPMDGEYPGIAGDKQKTAILRRALSLLQLALAGDLEIAGKPVKHATIYRTGKYDEIYPQTADFVFPDEGVRLYFDDERLQHMTIRPSGTGNALRFHVQLHAKPTADNLIDTKRRLNKEGKAILDDIRKLLKAPRE